MKKIISLLCAMCLMLSLGAPAFAVKVTDFTDLDKTAWYYEAVTFAVDKALFEGTSANKFSPNATMTRGMFVTVLGRHAKVDGNVSTRIGTVTGDNVNLRDKPTVAGKVVASAKKGDKINIVDKVSGETAAELKWFKLALSNGTTAYIREDLMSEKITETSTKTPFTDVSPTIYYAPYVKWACDNGIALPVTKTQFAPNEVIAREDMCYMLLRLLDYLKLTPSYVKEATAFKDNSSITGYCREAVEAMQRFGVVDGYSDGNFKPQGGGTRAEVATVLMRFIKLESKVPDPPKPTSGFDAYLKANAITPKAGMVGATTVSPSDVAQFAYECLDAVGGTFYTPYEYNRDYAVNATAAQKKLEAAELMPIAAGNKSASMIDVAKLSVNAAIYYDAEIKGNYSDAVYGTMLREYYSLVYTDFAKFAKTPANLVAPTKLLNYLNISENSVITREIFARFFIMMREATTNAVVDLTTYRPVYAISDIKNMPEMKMLHKLGVFQSGNSLYLHPERVLNLYELKGLFDQLLTSADCFKNSSSQSYAASGEQCYNAIKNAYDIEPFVRTPAKYASVVSNELRTSSYLSQFDGGRYENINGVPTSCAMLHNWHFGNRTKTGAMVRAELPQITGEWTSGNAQSWLTNKVISFDMVSGTATNLKIAIDSGAIVQAFIDDGKVGKSVVIMGYRLNGSDLWFEVLDPAESALGEKFASDSKYIYFSQMDYMLEARSDRMIVVK